MSDAMDKLDAARKRLKELGCTGMNISVYNKDADPDTVAADVVRMIEKVEDMIAHPEKYDQEESMKRLAERCGCPDRFAKTSVADMKEAGKEAGESLKRL
jgi:hypothetical protein